MSNTSNPSNLSKSVFKDALKNRANDKSNRADLKHYTKLLQAAYCDEWVAVYQYSIESDFLLKLNTNNLVSDKAYNQITKELMKHTQEEFNHAKLLVPELYKIGSEPIYQIDMLQLSSNGQLLIPETNQDIILNQAIEAETNAIKVYTELLKFANAAGVTNQHFVDTLKFILDQEKEHKSDLEKLLKEFKVEERIR